MVFPARRDWCLQTVLHLLFLGLLGGLLAANFGNMLRDPSAFHLVQVALWSAYAVYFVARFFWTEYEITETELIVRGGFSRVHVPLDRIFEVSPTRGGVVDPVLSHDALKIRFISGRIAGYSVVVSPRYKAGIPAELAARSPRLQPCGESLKAVDRAPVLSREA